jgi:hypothetical protein
MATQTHQTPAQNVRFQYPAGTVHAATNLLRLNQAAQKVKPSLQYTWEDQDGRIGNVAVHRSRCILVGTACEWSGWEGTKREAREFAAAYAIQQVYERYQVTPY